MVRIDSETLFNGAAAFISTIAASFFILNVDFGYSPVSKILLVLLFLAGIFVITQRTADLQLTVLGYGVIVVSSLVLFFDVVNTFDVENTLTVLGLLGIAGLLFYLRTRLDEDSHFVTGKRATYALGIVGVLTVAVLLVDVGTGSLAYELQPESEIEYADSRHEETRIASVVVRNPTPFPERVRSPNYGVCTAGNWSEYRRSPDSDGRQQEVRANVYVQDGYNEYVFGYSTKTYPVELHIDGTDIQGEAFPVEVTSTCPDEETGPAYIALFEAPENRPNIRLV